MHRRLVFFFFQAEDGIRDYKVTGVQTCALPISYDRPPLSKGLWKDKPLNAVWRKMEHTAVTTHLGRKVREILPQRGCVRSEERRVGKEGGWRWGGGQ